MRHASLFSGIGGFELAADWLGWDNVLSCEFASFPREILQFYYPFTHHYGDIRSLKGTKYRGKIDVLTGGFPCQPFSAAGKRKGTDDNRFLWPEMLRVISEIQPTWVVAENVRGITSQGGGLVFERVHAELEAHGYAVQTFCIPACAVDAPHRRERMWFIACANAGRQRCDDGRNPRKGRYVPPDERTPEESEQERQGWIRGAGEAHATPADRPNVQRERGEQGRGSSGQPETPTRNGDCDAPNTLGRGQQGSGLPVLPRRQDGGEGDDAARRHIDASYAHYARLEGCQKARDIIGSRQGDHEYPGRRFSWAETWLQAAARLCRVDDGIPRGLDGQALWSLYSNGRGKPTISAWRRESLKAYGNAIVPQVAYRIFRAIEEAESD